MTIKEVKQSGNNVSVKYGNNTKVINNSTLIGNTSNAVFVVSSGKMVTVYVEQGGNLVATSSRINLASNAIAKVCGNTLEIKIGNTRHIYDEKGKSIKTISC